MTTAQAISRIDAPRDNKAHAHIDLLLRLVGQTSFTSTGVNYFDDLYAYLESICGRDHAYINQLKAELGSSRERIADGTWR